MAALSSIIIAGVGLAVAGFGQYKQMKAQKKAAKEQKAQAQASNRRQRRQAIREAAIRKGQIENAGAQIGGGVSNVAAGLGSTSSQLGGQLGFNASIEQSSMREARQMQKAANFKAIGGIGSTIFSFGSSGVHKQFGGGGNAPGATTGAQLAAVPGPTNGINFGTSSFGFG